LGQLSLKRQTGRYLVFLCPRCGSIRYSKGEQKTAKCFRCGYQILIDPSRVKVLYETSERTDALEAVKKYKMKLAERRGK